MECVAVDAVAWHPAIRNVPATNPNWANIAFFERETMVLG
jgi:hypothetical protein